MAPFEYLPADTCSDSEVKGVLLIHGLLDTAYALQDIGRALQNHCFLVRGILLPGHGTRPADLIGIERQQWIDSVAFGIRSLKKDANDIYVLGYSLGGTLALNAALNDPDIKGVILIAPALEVAYSWLASQSLWYRYFSNWVDVDPHLIPVRYQSMPTDAIAQTYLLSRQVQSKLGQSPFSRPVFLLLSATDLVIDAEDVLEIFTKSLTSSQNRTWVYGQTETSLEDPRIQVIEAFLPDQKILNYSHIAMPYAPDNPVFGKAGSHKECGLHIGLVPQEEAKLCMKRETNWKGEVGSTEETQYLPIQRLTYNPQFREMTKAIQNFLQQQ